MQREVENKLLLIKLITLTQNMHVTKLRQLVFILQEEGRKEQKKTFNYEFVKWNIEAYCPELERDLEHLVVEGFVENKKGVHVTVKGKEFLAKQARFFAIHKLQSFFCFYVYVYRDFPLYQLTNMLFKRYELARFQDKDIISVIQEEVERPKKTPIEETRRQVQRTYQELEKKDESYMKKVQEVMQDLQQDYPFR